MNGKDKNFDPAMAVTLLIVTVILLILSGHLSAVVSSEGFQLDQLTEQTLQHIKAHPFDVLHFNVVVFSMIGFGTVMMVIMAFSKPVVPKAEMKGTEHGSNDFQTRKELDEFIRKNTTAIFDLNDYAGRKKGGMK